MGHASDNYVSEITTKIVFNLQNNKLLLSHYTSSAAVIKKFDVV